jgi:hypothetical protein
MMSFDYSKLPFAIRPDIAEAYREYWGKLAKPGNWWTGEQRVAIADESRRALDCEFCKVRKEALSPYGSDDGHQHGGILSTAAVDAVHRVVTDQNRITRQWIENNDAGDLQKPAYVELVGIVVAMFSIDEFHRALGLDLETLPTPKAGYISRYTPSVLSEDIGFVPTVAPEGAVGEEADLWEGDLSANVIRALTLVPNALRDWRDLSGAQYLSFVEMKNFIQSENRSIDRKQMELIAGRVSSVNECFY